MTDATPIRRRRGRPSKDDPGPGATRAELLRTGVALLTEKGFSAAGLDEVLKSAGVPKGSFYHYFESKEAFGLALIDEYGAYFARKLDRFFADQSLAPLDRLAAFVTDARDGMARHGFKRGCLVGTLGQEMGALPDSFRQRLIGVFADWQHRTALCFEAAQRSGHLSGDTDCARLAEWFWIGWEGAVMRAKLAGGPGPLECFSEGFFRLIG